MSDKVKVLASADEFQNTVGSGTVLVDFYATWCGPCRMQLPILELVADRVEGKATIIKVNTEEFAEIATQFEIQSIPTLILFRDGQPVERFVGLQQESVLLDAINKQ